VFKDAKPCVVPDTTFARAVDRALLACFVCWNSPTIFK
jgi:hypothetical protein